MAETTNVPAPLASPHASSASQPRAKNNASQRSKKNDAPKLSERSGTVRKKQSKSRNGCVTCKAKRLKCDEVKPTCQQCLKRSVACEGYKQDFKWRPFEEPGGPGKSSVKSRKGQSTADYARTVDDHQSHGHQQFYDRSAPTHDPYQVPLPQFLIADMYSPANIKHSIQFQQLLTERNHNASTLSSYVITPQSISPVDCRTPVFLGPERILGDASVVAGPSEITAPSSVAAGQSPQLMDLLLLGNDHCALSEEYLSYQTQHEAFYQCCELTDPAEADDEDVEEIPRNLDFDMRPWSLRQSSPTPSRSSGSSVGSQHHFLPMQIQESISSTEAIVRRFHRDTCGVLSVKNGPTENPWRTLVWPLARDCPALYHAIASMTSFHQSAQFPPTRIQGMDHMQTAIQALAEGLGNMRFDAAISTTLVLAFAESWDMHISTGINHIKGAKVLINQALVQYRQSPKHGDEWTRLKFLCNTWIYMDVIARLTSSDDDDSNDVDAIYDTIHSSGRTTVALDPLMGCAHSLFPIIGRVASLIRRLRKTSGDCSDLIVRAIHLKSQLEKWTPPSHIENPEDETTSPRDAIKTATAYQYATLLYLHQAFPGIPSTPALILAKKALCELASVEPSSRTCIVHIYPLMAAGCEMIDDNDRAWVIQRWELMSSRMKLGIIEKSLTVTKEVWARRDRYAGGWNVSEVMRGDSISTAQARKRNLDAYLDSNEDEVCWFRSTPKRRATNANPYQPHSISALFALERCKSDTSQQDSVERLRPDFTVEGYLHWLGVMRDWGWEVLLG